jgi:hypothetical protein
MLHEGFYHSLMSTSRESSERPSLQVLTQRFKVRAEANTWLNAAAT